MDVLKGNLLVGQSGGPTAVINSTLAGVLHDDHVRPVVHPLPGELRTARDYRGYFLLFPRVLTFCHRAAADPNPRQ